MQRNGLFLYTGKYLFLIEVYNIHSEDYNVQFTGIIMGIKIHTKLNIHVMVVVLLKYILQVVTYDMHITNLQEMS